MWQAGNQVMMPEGQKLPGFTFHLSDSVDFPPMSATDKVSLATLCKKQICATDKLPCQLIPQCIHQ